MADQRLDILPGAPEPRLPTVLTDASGTRVEIADTTRIVPLNGAIAEIVFTLGLGPRVVARDVSATFPEAVALPVVTNAHDVAPEQVLAQHPTVILADTETGPPEAVEQLRSSGVPVVLFEPVWTLGGVEGRITEVADALGVPDRGAALVERTHRDIEAARALVPAGTKAPRIAFLYVRGGHGVQLIGGEGAGSDDIIETVGGVDVGTALGLRKYTPITSEALIGGQPDVFLLMTHGLESIGGMPGLRKMPGLAQTPAGRESRVITVEDGVVLNFGPRTAAVIRALVELLYTGPDALWADGGAPPAAAPPVRGPAKSTGGGGI
ncbi:heme/hemin ABC transporter substrate-binding protein [Yinghuangia sp. YIM S09857]|uniref:heme/hemin ABC transporter substrate-binding protein n=1 Tax=Yinghuangia sp. YIM S09857 TaxID=3436929 RepID=UPI003F52B108